MADYFDEVDHARLRADYPVGDDFLNGVAQIGRDQLRELQNRRFRQLIARAWQVPFYRRRWSAAGIEPGDITGLDDLAKLPAFSKADLMQSVADYPPFGDYHGVDLSAGARRPQLVVHTTSGTTGAPQPLIYGAYDREAQNLLLARAYLLQGLRPDDIVHSIYGFGMVNGGHYTREALIHFTKAIVLTAGTGLETRSEQQVELMRLFGVTVLVGFVDYLKRLGQLARDMGLEPGRDVPVRMISGHMGAEDPAAISALWGGAEVFDWYGVGDTGVVAAEGPDHDGLYIFEDAHLVEIIDPESGAVLADGAAGNICVTVLFKQAVYPIVRFDTKDVSSIITAPNTIDIGFRRLAGFQGRSDNMIKLRGVNVYPTAIGVHLEGHARATGEFVCKVHRVDHRDEMTVVVEVDRVDAPGLAQEFRALLRQKLGVETGIELVGPGETAALTQIEARQKPIRLIDERAK